MLGILERRSSGNFIIHNSSATLFLFTYQLRIVYQQFCWLADIFKPHGFSEIYHCDKHPKTHRSSPGLASTVNHGDSAANCNLGATVTRSAFHNCNINRTRLMIGKDKLQQLLCTRSVPVSHLARHTFDKRSEESSTLEKALRSSHWQR